VVTASFEYANDDGYGYLMLISITFCVPCWSAL